MYIESLKKFVKYFGAGRKLKLAVFFVMSLIAGVLEFFGVALIYPFVIMLISPEKTYDMFQFIPHFNGYPVKHLALALGGAALLLFVVKNLYMVLFVFVQNKFVQKWTQYINNKFMLFYLYAPYERILKISNTDKLYVITTLSAQATGGFLIRIMTLVTNLSIVLLILGLILLKFPIAGFVSLAFIFVCIVLQNLIFKGKTRELGMKLQETSKKVNAINYTIINNIKDIKIFSCEKSFYNYLTYTTLFPQIIAGPIVRYETVDEELVDKKISLDNFSLGMKRFIVGLGKKVLIANNVGALWNVIETGAYGEMTVLLSWIGIISFALQIYFDFSGYSDMAIGLAKIFGMDFDENFNFPYISKSITEFWRRWHITLSSWFRDYIYIPLGGNRKGLLKQIRNILIVWALTRSLAWGILEFCAMGCLFWHNTYYRKIISIKSIK